MFWILAHKHENHKWMFFIGFNGGLASVFSTKNQVMHEAMARLSVSLSKHSEMAETHGISTSSKRWTEGYTSKEVVKKNKGFWWFLAKHHLHWIQVACCCPLPLVQSWGRDQDATSRRATETTWAQFHSTDEASICLSDMSSKINQHKPDINQQWTMTLMNILCMIHTWIIIIIIIIHIYHRTCIKH